MSRTLRNKKNFHALVKGTDIKYTGIYLDFSKMQQGISGMSTSIHASFETLDEAVAYMVKHSITSPEVITYKDGLKFKEPVADFKVKASESESQLLSQPLFDSTTSESLSPKESIISRVQGSPMVNKLKDTLKSFITNTPAKSHVPSNYSRDILADSDCTVIEAHNSPVVTRQPQSPHPLQGSFLSIDKDEDAEVSFATSTPFRVTPTGHTQDIGHISEIPTSDQQSAHNLPSVPNMLPKVNLRENTHIECGAKNKVSAEIQVDILTNQQVTNLKSEISNLKRQQKALLAEKDGLMKRNAGLRNANEILTKKNDKLSQLNKKLSTVDQQKNHLVKEKQQLLTSNSELQRLLDEAVALNAANVVPDGDSAEHSSVPARDSPTVPAVPTVSASAGPTATSPSGATVGNQPAPEAAATSTHQPAPLPDNNQPAGTSTTNLPSGTVSYPAHLLPDDLAIWLTSQLPLANESDDSPPPEPVRLSDPSLTPVKFRLGGDYPELSNLRHCNPKLRIFGKTFKSKDHAYQWKKALVHNDPFLADKIRRQHSAKQAMFLGRRISTNTEWKEKTKFSVMREVNEAALEQDPGFRSTLISTGERPLMEDTDHSTWGHLRGGRNELGKLYEQLRHELITSDPNLTEQLQDRLNHLRDDASAQPQPSSNAEETHQDDSVLSVGMVFGDSNSQGVHPRVVNYICRTVPIPGGKVCPDASEHHKKPLSHYLSSAMSGDEKDIILACGTNDAATCDPVQFKQGYTELVRIAASKGANVICSSIYHRADLNTTREIIGLNTRIDILNQQIKEVARAEGATFVDNCADVGSSSEYPNTDILSRPKYGPRYLHLRDNGRVDLAARLGNAIAPSQNSRPRNRRGHPGQRQRPPVQSSLNPEAPTWISQSPRDSYLYEQTRRWFEYADQVEQTAAYPRRSRNTPQW